VVLGAFFKFFLNEGLTRWQLSTGTTLIEGVVSQFGRPVVFGFLGYLIIWTYYVAAALMSASGVALYAILPFFQDATTGKIVYGIICSIVGIILVRLGGYQLFEKIMKVCIGLMFITVVVTAVILIPDWISVLRGLVIPTIPKFYDEVLSWTVALIGGVGGTVTILCYGYWIREEGRYEESDLRNSRIDLAVAYFITAIFGLSMVIIGSTVRVEGGGATLIIQLSERLVDNLGITGKWIFLLGAFGAIFSSLLGVWQSVPYLFADIWKQISIHQQEKTQTVDTNSKPYRYYLYGMALIPILGLWTGFATMQKLYTIIGALFIPLLALTLLILNGRVGLIGDKYKNKSSTWVILIIILLFFLWIAWMKI
jgi:Mn2+/Fe2+ NRAMP family transporter